VVAVAENVKENANILLFARKATGGALSGRFGGVAIMVEGRRRSDNSFARALRSKALSA
jgi:hypothetical protein